jgi:hypothetical protein
MDWNAAGTGSLAAADNVFSSRSGTFCMVRTEVDGFFDSTCAEPWKLCLPIRSIRIQTTEGLQVTARQLRAFFASQPDERWLDLHLA